LKTKRFSTAGRQKRKHIAVSQRIVDDFLLQRPECVVTEVFLQRTVRIHKARTLLGAQRNWKLENPNREPVCLPRAVR
jgi:hypothetical protein